MISIYIRQVTYPLFEWGASIRRRTSGSEFEIICRRATTDKWIISDSDNPLWASLFLIYSNTTQAHVISCPLRIIMDPWHPNTQIILEAIRKTPIKSLRNVVKDVIPLQLMPSAQFIHDVSKALLKRANRSWRQWETAFLENFYGLFWAAVGGPEQTHDTRESNVVIGA